MNSVDIDTILAEGSLIDFYVSTSSDGDYRVNARFEYEGNNINMRLASLESPEELGEFYRDNLIHLEFNSSTGVYGNSPRTESNVAESESWSMVRDGEWAVDVFKALDKHMDWENSSYDQLINHTSASAFAATALSENYGERRPEDYTFYLDMIKDLEREGKPKGVKGRVKKKAKDKVKKEASAAAQSAVEEAQREFRRMEREGEIEEIKKKARKEASERGSKAARSAVNLAKQKTREKARKEAEELKHKLEGFGGRIRTFSPLSQQPETEGEAPEPTLTIETENGVTIYEYGDPDPDFLEEKDERR